MVDLEEGDGPSSQQGLLLGTGESIEEWVYSAALFYTYSSCSSPSCSPLILILANASIDIFGMIARITIRLLCLMIHL